MPKATRRSQTKREAGAGPRSLRIPALAALLAMTCLALAFVTRPAASQSDSSQTPDTTAQALPPQPDPPGMIDGAKDPDLIPDDAAYRAVFLAFAEREDATDAERARFQAKIRLAGLGEDDEAALFVILTAFKKQTDDLKSQASEILAQHPVPHPDSVEYKKLLDIDQQGRAAFHEAMSALPARLTSGGVTKLDVYIKGEKRRMKYTPDISAPSK